MFEPIARPRRGGRLGFTRAFALVFARERLLAVDELIGPSFAGRTVRIEHAIERRGRREGRFGVEFGGFGGGGEGRSGGQSEQPDHGAQQGRDATFQP